MVPSEYVIRDVLIRVKPADLDRALRRWNELYAQEDQTWPSMAKLQRHEQADTRNLAPDT
jgi:hypothetical protein